MTENADSQSRAARGRAIPSSRSTRGLLRVLGHAAASRLRRDIQGGHMIQDWIDAPGDSRVD